VRCFVRCWQLVTANGYAIADEGYVATVMHVLEPPAELPEARLFAATADDEVLPVVSILAVDHQLDVAIVRVAGFAGAPLPLDQDVAPGDAAFCFSDPADERGFFSSGAICRFVWATGVAGDPGTLEGVRTLRLDVSTPWAPGSSGAAVLDAAGNAVGQAWSIFEIGGPQPPAVASRTPAVSWIPRSSITTTSPSWSVGTGWCVTRPGKRSPLMAPSTTTGAVGPVERRAARTSSSSSGRRARWPEDGRP